MQVSSSIVYASRAEQFVRSPRPASASARVSVAPGAPRQPRFSEAERASSVVPRAAKYRGYGFNYGYAYGYAYGHDYGDDDWGGRGASSATWVSPSAPAAPAAPTAPTAPAAPTTPAAPTAPTFAGAEPDAGTFTYRAPTVSTPASNPPASSPSPTTSVVTALTNAFPLWVLLGAIVGLTAPAAVTWFKGASITVALAVTMLGMGLTLELDEFRDAVSKPSQVALGVALQYTIMPILGLVIGRMFPVARPVAVGLILVGCCPGGTASNLVTYLGRANVALSVVLTTASTFLAAFMTPFMTKTLAGTLVPVDAAGLMASTLQVVLLPILGGLTLKRLFPAAVAAVAPFCPLVAVFTVALICSSIIGQSAAAIASAGWTLLLAVACLHCAGFALGYGFSGLLGFPVPDRRTVSIEVGMQNSALGVVLATAHFADPLVAVPCAISATVHSCVGSAVAGAWRLSDKRKSS